VLGDLLTNQMNQRFVTNKNMFIEVHLDLSKLYSNMW